MTPETLPDLVFAPAFSLLPRKMDTPEARTMLCAIALQESRLIHRMQIGGPARGYWQFERMGGVIGVLNHSATSDHAIDVCDALGYSASSRDVYEAIAHNDTLACCFARLLLWTLPAPMATDATTGWDQYLSAWRPGKPHPESWDRLYEHASDTFNP